ncbi:CBS domain-containing protein [Photobacterium minamisatsumaniensis]|uniref:CBS domain-containing protein n=1 Tax=Photobacterium minamisatsumaniensis TaxID=2910233 RepID=UPI003D0AD283
MSALLTVRDIVNVKAPTLSHEATLPTAIDVLSKNHVNGAPVCDADGILIGFLSAHDIMVEMWCQDYLPDHDVRVKDLMKTELVTLNIDDPLTDVIDFLALDKEQLYPTTAMGYATQLNTLSLEGRAKSMKVNKPQVLPVLENGKYVGVVSRQEVLKALRALFNDATTPAPVAENVAPQVVT